ncbi:MAG TPA: hypothetical protein IGS52_11760 [Oscillatoriaceae cyanobacterium M33_DOE_052]|uniref:Uncharacterized protein n=1 Tax=Planktothricoides sp. SpSt-374 TaxID=2282167 RepID=A0A7C3VKJ3_9CYAN|nr:hypothetical protein [Oscillatoriaceae cyanobacterium M33_DOE_052]
MNNLSTRVLRPWLGLRNRVSRIKFSSQAQKPELPGGVNKGEAPAHKASGKTNNLLGRVLRPYNALSLRPLWV